MRYRALAQAIKRFSEYNRKKRIKEQIMTMYMLLGDSKWKQYWQNSMPQLQGCACYSNRSLYIDVDKEVLQVTTMQPLPFFSDIL
jgi:hypothetical protein